MVTISSQGRVFEFSQEKAEAMVRTDDYKDLIEFISYFNYQAGLKLKAQPIINQLKVEVPRNAHKSIRRS